MSRKKDNYYSSDVTDNEKDSDSSGNPNISKNISSTFSVRKKRLSKKMKSKGSRHNNYYSTTDDTDDRRTEGDTEQEVEKDVVIINKPQAATMSDKTVPMENIQPSTPFYTPEDTTPVFTPQSSMDTAAMASQKETRPPPPPIQEEIWYTPSLTPSLDVFDNNEPVKLPIDITQGTTIPPTTTQLNQNKMSTITESTTVDTGLSEFSTDSQARNRAANENYEKKSTEKLDEEAAVTSTQTLTAGTAAASSMGSRFSRDSTELNRVRLSSTTGRRRWKRLTLTAYATLNPAFRKKVSKTQSLLNNEDHQLMEIDSTHSEFTVAINETKKFDENNVYSQKKFYTNPDEYFMEVNMFNCRGGVSTYLLPV